MKPRWSILQRLAGWKQRASSLEGLLLAVTLPLTLLLCLSDAGSYLNSYLFFQPTVQFRAYMGWQPVLDPAVRLVLFEDRSIERLGREPTLAEWQQVANVLFHQGYEKVFYLGVAAGDDIEDDDMVEPEGGRLTVGAVVVEEKNNNRAQPFAKMPASLFVAYDQAGGSATPFSATKGIAPDKEVLARSSALGNLNIFSNYEMPAAYDVGSGRLLPNMGLLAVDGLHWDGDKLRNAHGPVPLSDGGTLYIDFVDPVKSLAFALPVTSFFEQDMKSVRTKPTPKIQERLKGGKIAVLVPDAFTGSRFLDAPSGKVLSYFAVVSMIQGTLHDRFLHRPAADWCYFLVALPLLVLLLRSRNPRIALVGSMAAALLWIGLSGTLLLVADWMLPCAQISLLIFGGFLVRLANHMMATLSEKMALNKEMEMGRLVQQVLLPKVKAGSFAGYEYKVVFKPYWPMAGDWFQIFDSTSEQGGSIVVIGDSVGKGPGAALNTAVIAAVWNNFKDQWQKGGCEIKQLIHSLERTIYSTFSGQQCTTISVAHLAPTAVRLTALAAPHWLHVLADGTVKSLRSPAANPMGLFDPDAEPPTEVTFKDVELKDGEVLLAMTDGVMEGSSSLHRFRRALKEANLDLKSPEAFERLEQMAIESGKNEVLPDDLTLLLIRRQSLGEGQKAA